MLRIITLVFVLITCSYANNYKECDLSKDVIKEIQSYKPIVDKIIDYTTNGTFKGKTYELLAEWVDRFGSRLIGTQNLENSIDYLITMMGKNTVSKIHTENATVPHWERYLFLITHM